jgi:hypothetical protein
MITVRSNCQVKDGRIHADATFKLATLLLYLNEPWVAQGGRLRVLRSDTDIEDYAAEGAAGGRSAVLLPGAGELVARPQTLRGTAPLRHVELLQRRRIPRPGSGAASFLG